MLIDAALEANKVYVLCSKSGAKASVGMITMPACCDIC